MIKRSILLFSFILLGLSAKAEVEKVDVYFLSRPTTVLNLPLFTPLFKGLYTENLTDTECVPMGDGCFHPQYGYIEDKEKAKGKKIEAKPKEVQLKTINAEEVDLVDCDDEYYFDLYCGKAGRRKATVPADVELWVDTSASMKLVDYSSEDAYCDRRRLVANLRKNCKKGIEVSVFNTAKKRLSTLDNLCINHGTNDGDRVVQWLKQTDTKHVIIITDMEEYIGVFREYLDSIGANIHGIGVDPLLSTELTDLEKEFVGFCK